MNINFSCRYKRKDISSAPPSGILRNLRFLPPCSVHHETSQLYIACSFSSPDGQRCRDGCYGDTLLSFCSVTTKQQRARFSLLTFDPRDPIRPSFASSIPYSFTVVSMSLLGLPHDVETLSIRQQDRFLSSTKTLLRLTLFITLGKSKFSGNTDSYRFSIECRCCISNIMFQFFG